MSIGILGKKLGMSQLFDDKGNSVPVTLIEAGPCRVTQLKTTALDGYTAVQIGYGLSKEKHLSKPEKGHLLKSGEELLKHLNCLLYTSPSPRDGLLSRMPSSA